MSGARQGNFSKSPDRPEYGPIASGSDPGHFWGSAVIVFDNRPRDDDTGTVSTFGLNRHFDFAAVGDDESMESAYRTSSGHTICTCASLSGFISNYLYLSMPYLTVILRAHGIPVEGNKTLLLGAAMRHVCSDACLGMRLVFTRRKFSRPGPFPPRGPLQPVVDATPSTFSRMEDLTVLPVLLNNDIQVDVLDGVQHISTYLLNCSYKFVEVVTPDTLQSLHVADMGVKFVAAHTTDIAEFVALYHNLSVKQLSTLCTVHGVCPGKTKTYLLESLLTHRCFAGCSGSSAVLLFASTRRVREGITPRRTVESIKADEASRRSKFELTKLFRKSAQAPSFQPLLRKDAVHKAAEDARENFPFVADLNHRRGIAKQWQDEMDPRNWIPCPCAVCARRTATTQLMLCNPLHYDLTLLRNPSLPVDTLPTLYNLQAYDGAILWAPALRDTAKKAAFEMCLSCKAALDGNQQPLDSLANFHYFAREELSADVKLAFSEATMYDKMLVSHSRCTRITHLFSDKDKREVPDSVRATSQRYSKGNVAIFAQDVASLRLVLPPSREEIHEAMCALFVGPATVPSRDNIKSLKPVIVSKRRVEKMIHFLLRSNAFYAGAGLRYSQANLDAVFPEDGDEGVPEAVELCCLPDGTLDTISYADRGESAAVPDTPSSTDGETVMEAVGYTVGERTAKDLRNMKASAVAWCLDRNNFIQMKSGSKFLSDRDPGFLTFNFPHLDPWGIGGFHEPNRTESQKISFERQVRNLLLQDDGVFQKDPNFAYVCWNIMQKADVNRQVNFRTSAKSQERVVSDIQEMAPVITDLIRKWELNPSAKPSNKAEKHAMRTLGKLKVLAKDLKGSSGYKQCRRNEIRALIKKLSTPALFITLNPADIADPLLAAIAGLEPEIWKSMDSFQRKVFVARNPGPAAMFFDAVVKAFIRIILRYDPSSTSDAGNGLFGRCSAYYGMVEAQGRGTLHCHMLVWIEGNPSPQELRDRMRDEPTFQDRMFEWLESIISCELPSTTEVVVENDTPLLPPKMPPGWQDPRLHKGPNVASMSDTAFEEAFRATVEELVIKSNWHVHNPTCWKYLKPGEPKTDATCRMRINGDVTPFTHLDAETESIVLRRLHPRINSYNDMVMFLLRCNMDIKYVGSGEAAKALVYYVTDYITKSSLSTHVGLSAVEYAIKRNNEKFAGTAGEVKDTDTVNRSLFTKTVMALMSKQELSHQQVMSYLVGGGDYYTSHTFKPLKWGEIDRFLRKQQTEIWGERETFGDHNELDGAYDVIPDGSIEEPEPLQHVEEPDPLQPDTSGETNGDEYESSVSLQHEEEVTLVVSENYVGVSTQVMDYPCRSRDVPFDVLCLWDHEEWVTKVSASSEDKRIERAEQEEARQTAAEYDGGKDRRKGRALEARGTLDAGHPQSSTHVARMRRVPVVNVILGETIPRPDRSVKERETWAWAMLILFKPWRTIADLKDQGEAWTAAFDRCEFSEGALKTMKNIMVENECKDARDAYEVLRKAGRARALLPGGEGRVSSSDVDAFTAALEGDAGLNGEASLNDDTDEDAVSTDPILLKASEKRNRATEEAVMLVLNRTCLWRDRNSLCDWTPSEESAFLTTEQLEARIVRETAKMLELAKDKRPLIKPPQGQPPSKRRRLNPEIERELTTTLNQLQFQEHTVYAHEDGVNTVTPEEHLHDIIATFGVKDNPEQVRALTIIAEHFMFGMEEQLLLYIAGVGGAGKSFVIKAVVEFFRRCGVSQQMMLSAPTGCAAVLIDGFTIHALTFLPRKKKEKPGSKTADLSSIWKNIRYLVIDEISMVSASLLAEISARLNEAQAERTLGTDTMFGKINVILLGDMGQLRPVLAKSLFARELVRDITPNVRETIEGVNSLYGAWLWREVQKVVILRKNFRSAEDPEYTNLLAHVRLGMAWDGRKPMNTTQSGDGRNFTSSDFNTLRGRQLQGLPEAEQRRFEDAPIICATRVVRNLLNRQLTLNHANKHRRAMHDYHSRDTFNGLPLSDSLQRRIWQVRSSITKDALGKLPLCIGMRVMITENIALKASVVNGAEGVLREIHYSVDEKGRRFVDCAYVEIAGSGFGTHPLGKDVVPIVPLPSVFEYVASTGIKYKVGRKQLPLVPAYAYTDYKAQGKSLKKVIVDLSGAGSLQSFYVMVSRATSLTSLAVLRGFKGMTLYSRLGEEFRDEFARLEVLDAQTKAEFECRRQQSPTESSTSEDGEELY